MAHTRQAAGFRINFERQDVVRILIRDQEKISGGVDAGASRMIPPRGFVAQQFQGSRAFRGRHPGRSSRGQLARLIVEAIHKDTSHSQVGNEGMTVGRVENDGGGVSALSPGGTSCFTEQTTSPSDPFSPMGRTDTLPLP